MPTLSTRISDGEFKANTEYANVSGLSVSDLLKKVLVHRICMLWNDHPADKYFCEMYHVEPESKLDTDEDLAEFVNKFRSYIGIRPLKVRDF